MNWYEITDKQLEREYHKGLRERQQTFLEYMELEDDSYPDGYNLADAAQMAQPLYPNGYDIGNFLCS